MIFALLVLVIFVLVTKDKIIKQLIYLKRCVNVTPEGNEFSRFWIDINHLLMITFKVFLALIIQNFEICMKLLLEFRCEIDFNKKNY